MKKVIDIMTKESILKCFKVWGIEKTEEKIIEHSQNETMKNHMLKNYYELIRKEK